MKYFYVFNHKMCNLFIAEQDGAICANRLNKTTLKKDFLQKGFEIKETALLKRAAKQLDEYFSGKRKTFDLPIILHGTDFQVKVWKALQRIPCGETCTYGEIAAMIGNPKASRAVGMANNRNPIWIIVPCHRVVGHGGKLVGYAGGLEMKERLLELERQC